MKDNVKGCEKSRGVPFGAAPLLGAANLCLQNRSWGIGGGNGKGMSEWHFPKIAIFKSHIQYCPHCSPHRVCRAQFAQHNRCDERSLLNTTGVSSAVCSTQLVCRAKTCSTQNHVPST